MTTNDVRVYLKEFARILEDGGQIYLTAFVEDDVPAISLNPDQYRAEWEGPLHCVRYSRAFFDSMLVEAGLQVDRFDHADEDAGQSSVYISKRADGPG
jgi:hypothetical protein